MSGFLSDEALKKLKPAKTSSFPSPIPTQIVSSDEFFQQRQNKSQREVEARLKEMTNKLVTGKSTVRLWSRDHVNAAKQLKGTLKRRQVTKKKEAQNESFSASCTTRGLTAVLLMTPNVGEVKLVSGLANCG